MVGAFPSADVHALSEADPEMAIRPPRDGTAGILIE